MSNNRLMLDGLSELRAALRQLPAELTGEASHEVEGAANGAAADIKRSYKSTQASLAEAVVVEHTDSGRFGAGSRVVNRHELAHLFEDGTQSRHTRIGVNRGSMPAGHVFIPRVIRARRAMYHKLKAMLVRHGLVVSGEARG